MSEQEDRYFQEPSFFDQPDEVEDDQEEDGEDEDAGCFEIRRRNDLSYKQLLADLEALEGGLERMPPFAHYESTKHFARIELANSVARAKEILEALAHDEDEN
jgi:hypothetical protein